MSQSGEGARPPEHTFITADNVNRLLDMADQMPACIVDTDPATRDLIREGEHSPVRNAHITALGNFFNPTEDMTDQGVWARGLAAGHWLLGLGYVARRLSPAEPPHSINIGELIVVTDKRSPAEPGERSLHAAAVTNVLNTGWEMSPTAKGFRLTACLHLLNQLGTRVAFTDLLPRTEG